MPSLDALNAMNEREFARCLLACCGARAWVDAMATRRPFRSSNALRDAADDTWRALKPSDWLEAFAHHPRIGERQAQTTTTSTASAWSAGEQAGVAKQSLTELARAQQLYEERFGHLFIVCAQGKSANEILTNLTSRMSNAPDQELRVAAEEQRQIMQLRLQKLLTEQPHQS